MKTGEFVIIAGKKNYLVKVSDENFSTEYGTINLSKLKKKKIGDKIKSNSGEEFLIAKPSFIDVLMKKCKRLPQIVMPKDAALILAYTGIPTNAKIVDAGAGSGFLSIFLAYYCSNGNVVTYEKNKEFAKIVRKNIEKLRLKNIQVKEKDILKGIEENNLDLITLDMKESENVIEEAYKKLKFGSWLVVYSPYIEQVKKVVEKMKNYFTDIITIENITREWKVNYHTLPKSSGIMHTGFLTFGRKLIKTI